MMARKNVVAALFILFGLHTCRGASQTYLRRVLGSGSGSGSGSEDSRGSGGGGSNSKNDSGGETPGWKKKFLDAWASGKKETGTGDPIHSTTDSVGPSVNLVSSQSSVAPEGSAQEAMDSKPEIEAPLAFDSAVCKEDEVQEQHYFTIDVDVSLGGTCSKPSETEWVRDLIKTSFGALAIQLAFSQTPGQGVTARNVLVEPKFCDSGVEADRRQLWWSSNKWGAPSDIMTGQAAEGTEGAELLNPDAVWSFRGGAAGRFCYPEFKVQNDIVSTNTGRPDFDAKIQRLNELIAQVTAQHEERRLSLQASHADIFAKMKLDKDELLAMIEKELLDEAAAETEMESLIQQERARIDGIHGGLLPAEVEETLDREETRVRNDFEAEENKRAEAHSQWTAQLASSQKETILIMSNEKKALQEEISRQIRILDVQRGRLQTEKNQWDYLRVETNRDKEEREVSNKDFYWVLRELEEDAKRKLEHQLSLFWGLYRFFGVCADKPPVISAVTLTPVLQESEATLTERRCIDSVHALQYDSSASGVIDSFKTYNRKLHIYRGMTHQDDPRCHANICKNLLKHIGGSKPQRASNTTMDSIEAQSSDPPTEAGENEERLDEMSVASSTFSEPFPVSSESIEEVVGNTEMTAGQARWAHYASNQNGSDDDEDDNFSAFGSVASSFSTPVVSTDASDERSLKVSMRSLGQNTQSAGSLQKIDEHGDTAIPGSHPEASSSVQQMLERKLGVPDKEADSTEEDGSVPRELHGLLERKFDEFDQTEESKQEDDSHSVATEQVTNRARPTLASAAQLMSARSHQSTTSSDGESVESSERPRDGQDRVPTNTLARTTRRRSTHAILGNQALDDQGRTLSPAELKELWAKTGMCTECGRVKTHKKVKVGLFWAFRRMEPLTTRGQAYKGYCLFCNDVEDLRGLLNEPNLKEEDVPRAATAMMLLRNSSVRNLNTGGGSANTTLQTRRASNVALRRQTIEDVQEASVAVASGDVEPIEEDKSFRSLLKNWKFLLGLGIFVVALIAVIIGAVVVLGGGDDGQPASNPPRTSPPTVPPTPSPTPPPVELSLIWQQAGPDLTGTTESFGQLVSLSQNGGRLAVSSPNADGGAGRVDVYEGRIIEGSESWVPLGSPIRGTAIDDSAGLGMALSSDGTTLIVGYPGKGPGHVRVFRYSEDSGNWLPLGEEVSGPTEGSQFGYSVDLNHDGTTIAIGAPMHVDSSDAFQDTTPGIVQTFRLIAADNVYVPKGQDLVGEGDGDMFGASVQIDNNGEFMAIGAPGNDEQFDDAGQVYMYVYTPDEWLQPLVNEFYGEDTGHQIGSHVALDGAGTTVASSAVDSTLDGIPGAGRIQASRIDFDNFIHEEMGLGIPPQPDTLGLGYSLGLTYDGNRMIVSSLNHNTTAGNVFVYHFGLDAVWEQIGNVIPGDELGTAEWVGRGPSVAISDDALFIAIGYESLAVGNRTSSPIVRVYEYGGN